ncbi:hypothetical protein SAY87_015498 [Trapa incisa]|uniref:Uncharacterized protein n=1 Tax=Trapa incisa TaxID=236973 RepID=A0AAN7JLE2_9MYRT|nr:hypothetical protein SAY87_015498 [Trapa incisa]
MGWSVMCGLESISSGSHRFDSIPLGSIFYSVIRRVSSIELNDTHVTQIQSSRPRYTPGLDSPRVKNPPTALRDLNPPRLSKVVPGSSTVSFSWSTKVGNCEIDHFAAESLTLMAENKYYNQLKGFWIREG